MIRSYEELIKLKTFEERFAYLKLEGREAFGFRSINQAFYRSREWKIFRNGIIVRDNGCDLGVEDDEIFSTIQIHHINPITARDIANGADCLLDPNNAISCSTNTHNAIHYNDDGLLSKPIQERRKGDTCPWKVF